MSFSFLYFFLFGLVNFACRLTLSLVHLKRAASTVAANIILRSSVAAGFPLFSKQMFENLGIQWAASLLGCLAAIMIPIPLTFRIYGPRLRQKSRLNI